jgi:hypothetical protein
MPKSGAQLHFKGGHPDEEAVSISETSVNFYQTTLRNIPEDSHLHTRRRENLKFHPVLEQHLQLCPGRHWPTGNMNRIQQFEIMKVTVDIENKTVKC